MNRDDNLQALLAELDLPTRTLLAEVDLGRQVPEFLATELGRYLLGAAAQEYAEAMEKLETVAFWRWRRVRELQNQAWRAKSFVGWLRSLIISGKSAENSLIEREES